MADQEIVLSGMRSTLLDALVEGSRRVRERARETIELGRRAIRLNDGHAVPR